MEPSLIWALLFAPLAAAAAITAGARRSRALSAGLSIGAVLFSFVVAVVLFLRIRAGDAPVVAPLTWLSLPGLTIEWAFALDRLSALMLLVVTGVGAAIHIYSIAYMRADPGFSRFFASLSFFTFAMLGIVLSANFIQIYIFWELVGLASYLLIGFWFERPSAAEAGKKAFIVNRIGDFGMLLGILMLWGMTGTVDFKEIGAHVAALGPDGSGLLAVAGLLIFCGAVGKSAQFPLHVWLPDAMEGPTPVSALIHAATMVAAGVYMLCRVSFLLVPDAAGMVAWIGGITALMAALIAIGQSDIKRILAYSTVSQLGYMVMAVGLGGPLQAMTHLTAHAFFKALLFLGAGSVIMALHHEQDIWKMGGLRRRLPLTFIAFLIGTLALAGIWPLSGFYTKDEILLLALERQPVLFLMGAAAAFCTAFYMGRLLLVAFLGQPRDKHLHDHAHEQGPCVLLPLALLAVLSVCSGWNAMIPRALQPGFHAEHHALWQEALLLAVPLLGFAFAGLLYRGARPSDQTLRRILGPAFGWFEHRFYIDECYTWLIRWVYGPIATFCAQFDDQVLQNGVIRGTAGGAGRIARCVRFLQNGDLRLYVFMFGLGVVLLIHLVGAS